MALSVAAAVIRRTIFLAALALTLAACGASRTAADADGRACNLVGTDTRAPALEALYTERHAALVVAGGGVYACPCMEQHLGGAAEKANVSGAAESAKIGGATEANRISGAREQANLGAATEQESVGGAAEMEHVGGAAEAGHVGGATEILTCSVHSRCKGVALSTSRDVATFDDRGLVQGHKGCVSR